MTTLTREQLIEAMSPTPGSNEIGYCIAVLHPGDAMYNPKSKPSRPSVLRNAGSSDQAFRLAHGMGWWVGPTSAGEIAYDDAPTVCSCGIGKHNPPTPDAVKARRAAEEAAAKKADDRVKAAKTWAHKRVEEMFNSGLAMSRDDILAQYRPVFDGLVTQWIQDNKEDQA